VLHRRLRQDLEVVTSRGPDTYEPFQHESSVPAES
jgi:hypothetical protein